MDIYAISLIKNEADIIEYNLNATSKWATKIFVYDNGSTDGTWERVQNISLSNKKIIPWKTVTRPFRDSLRAEVFSEFRHIAKDGDWWCFKKDADEFYIDDPREFLSKTPDKYFFVATQSIEYQLCIEDIKEYLFTGNFLEDIKKIRYYNPNAWSEKRFFRHKDSLIWPLNADIPLYIGRTYSELIRVKHYQYRSPQQIQLRLDTRRKAREDGFKGFAHAKEENWKEKLKKRKTLILDTNDGTYKIKKVSNRVRHTFIACFVRKILFKLKIYPHFFYYEKNV